MTLQKTGHRDSAYERPNQRWVCGWAEDGSACPLGPDGDGRCPARLEGECVPRKSGDRFVCTRPAVFGGPCEPGPRPDGKCCHPTPRHALCQPRRSLRARRAQLVRLVLVATLGVLGVALGGAWRLSAINPGRLTAVHEPIPAPDGASVNCGACHRAAAGGFGDWALALTGHAGAGDSDKCLTCHFRGAAGAFALAPHGIDPETLKALDPAMHGRVTPKLLLASFGDPSKPAAPEALACATCHREHRGVDHPISYLDNTRCQACHSVKFDAFAGSHPEFGLVHHEHGGIVFDHRTHKNTHYGKDRPFDCGGCHVLDASRRVEATLGYDTACAGCHSAGKVDHHGAKIAGERLLMFQLPDLGLKQPDVSWRNGAPTGPEVTPLMQLLLVGDEAARPALFSLANSGGDPTDWPAADEGGSLRRSLGAGVDRLLDDLLLDDSRWLRRRTAEALGVAADSGDAAGLANELEDGQRSLRGALAGATGSVAEAPAVQELAVALLSVEPTRAQVLAWVVRALCVDLPPAQIVGVAGALNSPSQNPTKIPSCAKNAAAQADAALNARTEALEAAADALHAQTDDTRTHALLASAAMAPVRLRLRVARALGVAFDNPKVEALLAQLGGAGYAVQQWRSSVVDGTPAADAGSEARGWSVRAKDAAVIYRPSGHADPFLRAWLDAAVALSGATGDALPAALRDHLGEAARATECLACHSINRSASAATVDWQPAGRTLDNSGFSNFDHGPHVELLSRDGCGRCHTVAAGQANGAHARGLQDHSKAVCAQCHVPGQANADCLTCHRYHRVAAGG